MNTFDDDNDLGFFETPPQRRPPRDRSGRRPRSGGPRGSGPDLGSNGVLRLAGLVALGILVVLGFILWVSSCGGSSKDSYTSYINAMGPLARDSASVGPAFVQEIGASGLTLQKFETDLTNWSQQEQTDYLAAQRLRPPGLLQSANAEAIGTFQMRLYGLEGLLHVLQAAKSKHETVAAAAAALTSQAQLLGASDIMWEQLYKLPVTAVLTSQGVTGLQVPSSLIVTNPEIVDPTELGTVYQRLGTPAKGGKVTGVHGSALVNTIAVEGGSSTTLSTTTTTTVKAGSNLTINVIVKDAGDFPEVQIPVTLSVILSGKSVYTHTTKIPQIASGATASVPFTNIQLPTEAFSHNASIAVTIHKVPGEGKLDNNSATYPVFFLLAP